MEAWISYKYLPEIYLVFMSAYIQSDSVSHASIESLHNGTQAHSTKKAFNLLPLLGLQEPNRASLEAASSPKKKTMEFRTLHLNSKPSPNGEGAIWNYVSTPTTLRPGETLPCEDVPAFGNAEKALWMEAKRVCEIDPAFQGWYVFIHSSQYIKSCGEFVRIWLSKSTREC